MNTEVIAKGLKYKSNINIFLFSLFLNIAHFKK